jgi:hypothetical protein
VQELNIAANPNKSVIRRIKKGLRVYLIELTRQTSPQAYPFQIDLPVRFNDRSIFCHNTPEGNVTYHK